MKIYPYLLFQVRANEPVQRRHVLQVVQAQNKSWPEIGVTRVAFRHHVCSITSVFIVALLVALLFLLVHPFIYSYTKISPQGL